MRAVITIIMCGAFVGCSSEDPPGPCEDGVLGEGETDVDCGGPTCGPCEVGQLCATSSDCFNDRCIAESGRCEALESVSFADPEYYVSGAKPYFVRAGDLDGDGDLDLVVGNELLNNVSVFRNEGTSTGLFERIGRYPTGIYPTGGAIVDLDGDGIPDVVTADYRGNSVSVLRGRGDGELRTAVTYPTIEGGETSTLAVGDVNGDGYIDVIAANPMAASASVFFGSADGTLVAAPPLELGGNHEPYSVVIADFDGDGRSDTALADDRTSTVFVWHGNGDGTFELSPERPAIGGQRSHIMIAHDMDRDGVLDLVISNRNSHSVSVLHGRGDGTFGEAHVIDLGAGNGPYAVAVADVNLDGMPDIVTPNFQSSTVSLLLGRRDGGYQVMSALVIGGTSYGIATGDLDGDGKPDVAVANAVSNMLAIVRNTSE